MIEWSILRPDYERGLVYHQIEIDEAQVTIKNGKIVDVDIMEPGDHLMRKTFVIFVKPWTEEKT